MEYFSVTFLGKDEKVQSALVRLSQLTQDEQGMVAALTLSSSKKNEKALENVADHFTVLEKAKKEEDFRNLLRANLDSPALEKVLDLQEKLNSKRLLGTGDWVTIEPLYQRWINQESSILWILGGPGAGKSYLSSRIVQHLHDVYRQGVQLPVPVSVGLFYIKEDDQQLRSINTILKSLASQLCKNDATFRSHAFNVCTSPDGLRSAKTTWKKLFVEFFGSTQYTSSALVVIDGIDEAPAEERNLLFEFLGDLERRPDGAARLRISILLVGRPSLLRDMQYAWLDRTIRIRPDFIEVTATKNGKDILNYITRGIRKVRAIHNMRPPDKREAFRQDIIKELTEGAMGMFLWVDLVLEEIWKLNRPSSIKAALKNAPQDLVKMIRRVFERLAADGDLDKDDLNLMLAWVACAERPLVLGELDIILKLRPPVGEGYGTGNALENDLRGSFASFFNLTRQDSLTTEDLQNQASESKVEHHDHHEEGSSDMGSDENDADFAIESVRSDPTTTVVQFSHASIRDYLKIHGRPADIGIGVDINDAQRLLATTCLSIIHDKDHSARYEKPNLADYAATLFLKHFASIDKSKIRTEDKKIIVKLLYSFFRDKSTLLLWWNIVEPLPLRMLDFVEICLANSEISEPIRAWFAEEACQEIFAPEDRDWARKAAASAKELFKPVASFLASRWLYGENVLWTTSPIKFLHYYLSIDDHGQQMNPDNTITPGSINLPTLSADRIRELANWAGLKQTVTWHGRLGQTFYLGGHFKDSMNEFDTVLRMDPGNIIAIANKGRLCWKFEDVPAAIEWQLKALEMVPENDGQLRCSLLSTIAMYRQRLGDFDSAIEASEKAFLANPKDFDAILRYFDCLDTASRSEDIMELAGKLDKETLGSENNSIVTVVLYTDFPESRNETLLTALLIIDKEDKIHAVLGKAARATGKLDFANQALESVVRAVEKNYDRTKIVKRRFELAEFYFMFAGNEDKALELCEALYEDTKEDRLISPLVREQCISWLSERYFAKASQAEKDGIDPAVWIQKLESLAKERPSTRDESEVITTRDVSSILGLWYCLHDRQAEAKECFRARILEGIEILTNDDPSDDIFGYGSLGETLLLARDKVNAAAAFSIANSFIGKSKELRDVNRLRNERRRGSSRPTAVTAPPFKQADGLDGAASRPQPGQLSEANDNKERAANKVVDANYVDEAEEPVTGSNNNIFLWYCDGLCKRAAVAWTSLHWCEFCLETCFCDKCIEKVKAGTLPFRKCSSEHTFFQVYPIDKSMEEIAAVKEDGMTKPHVQWLDRLRREYT